MTEPARDQQDQSPKDQLATNAEIVTGIRDAMGKQVLDVVVTISPENFAYVNGFVVPSQPLMRWRHALSIIRANGDRAILAVDMEESTVRNKLPEGLAKSKIALELDYLSVNDFTKLSACLPDAQFSAGDELLARQRQVSAGDTEMDIAATLTKGVYAMGADSFKLMIVATGERSVYPNVGPSLRRLRAGDVCRIEIFTVQDGYHAGVGLQLHEKPYLSRYSDVSLEAGMVLGIGPLVYDTGFGFGMQNKDMFLVTESGCELLSNHMDTDQLIVISCLDSSRKCNF